MSRYAAMASAFFAASLVSSVAGAAAPELRLHASATTVEVGDTVDVTFEAMSTDGPPSQATLSPIPGFTIASSHASPSQQLLIVNGVRSERRGMTAVWTLRAERIGTFTIGPATVDIGTTRHQGRSLHLTVVAQGSHPAPPPSPSQLFGGLFDPFNGFEPGPLMPQREPEVPGVPLDPKLALDRPREALAFLHATVDKTSVIVGEQVILTVYLYIDLTAREPEFGDAHEATTDDFIRKSLMKDETASEDAGFGLVGGRAFMVKVLRRMALFPLKSGAATIGPMRLAVMPRGGPRQSEALSVRVSEPPLAGRPAGYETGNVGAFAVSVEVTPRTTPRAGAVGVEVTLSGTGNLPSELPVPLQTGVLWLQPEVHEKLGPTPGPLFGGTRTFSYVVRFEREGEIALGELAVPFFDPATRKFAVARAPLGTVRVTPSNAPVRGDDVARLAEVPAWRTSLGGTKGPAPRLSDGRWARVLLVAPPLSFVLAVLAGTAVRRARARNASVRASPIAALKIQERQRDAALKGDDGRVIDASSIRVIEAAVLAYLGANLRASTGDAVVVALTDRGLTPEFATAVRTLLSECESARFAPDAATASEARERPEKVRALAAKLANSKR